MTNPATRKGVGDGQAQPTDWEAIEREYRAGVLSIREIAKRHGITDKAIRKHALKHGWTRDLTDRVREKVRTDLVRTPVRSEDRQEQVRTEKEIVEDAAATVIALVREHRADLKEGRELATMLLSQLRMAAGNRDALIALIDEVVDEMPATTGADRSKREAQRKALMAAVSLPTHVAALRDLSNVLKNIIPLERQAFNVDEGAPDAPPENDPHGPQPDASLEAFKAAMAKYPRLNAAA